MGMGRGASRSTREHDKPGDIETTSPGLDISDAGSGRKTVAPDGG
jgi:hypothetical protein